MNKGVIIGVGIIIAGIVGAYAFFGMQEEKAPEDSAQIGIIEEAEIKITAPTEAQQEPIGEEAELGIEEEAEIEVVGPEEELVIPPTVNITAEEKMGFKDEKP